MRTIHFYGDSWTRGDGSQSKPGSGVIPPYKKYGNPNLDLELKKYSFPAQVGLILNNEYKISNNGRSGSSNYQIYRNVVLDIGNSNIKKGDVVVVTWSSIIRDPLQFLFLFQSEDSLLYSGGLDNSIKGFLSDNIFYPNWLNASNIEENKKLARKVYNDYVVDRMNFNILYEMTMNYICNLQVLFNEIDVNYIFINGFENVISKDIYFYNKINKEKWLLFDSTLSDYLCDIEETLDLNVGYSVWEDDFIKPGRNLDGPHPNRIGYGYIANLISNEIINRKLL